MKNRKNTTKTHDPQRRTRTIAIAALVVLGLFATACEDETRDSRPNVAIAIGDSFVSGEGAQDFITGDGAADYTIPTGSTLPSPLFIATTTEDPYFCHLSTNSSIFQTSIIGIDEQINLACSGADPEDLTRNNPDHPAVLPQIDQLLDAMVLKDVDVILVGFGANNSVSNFSSVLGYCHVAFMVDAAGGLAANPVEAAFANSFPQTAGFPDDEEVLAANGCDGSDFYSSSDLDTISLAYESGLEELMEAMRSSGYMPGDFRLVVQGYGSPFADEPDEEFRRDNGKEDDADRFAGLARERYEAGCPLHWNSLRASAELAQMLSSIGQDAAERLRGTYPDDDIVFLDVQRAFDGGRLCEEANSPIGALFNPIWFRHDIGAGFPLDRTVNSNPTRTFAATWFEMAEPCSSVSGLCQDSAHPNQAGHAVLGECLTLAVAFTASDEIECRRASNGSISVNTL